MTKIGLRLRRNQQGLVSFFVVTVIMIVLTLIVLAFSQLVNREQRQTVDRQLNTQAMYAAESGVNDAVNWLKDNADDPMSWGGDCDDFISYAGLNNDLDGVTSYSCLLVEPAPGPLEYSVPTDESAIFQLTPATSSITQLQISWQDGAGGGTDVTCTNAVGAYPGDGNQGCNIGNLRLEILPFSGPTSRSSLIDNRYTAYVQPGGAGTGVWGSGTGRAQGQPLGATCAAGVCRITITGVPNITTGYMRISSIYRPANVTIQASDGTTSLSMEGAQFQIDATGRASDVLHRIRANVPIGPSDEIQAPEFALQTRRTQCKRFGLAPPAAITLFGLFGPLPAQECDPRVP